jgi:DNA-binding GntR family transcriptional regulator
MNATRRKSGSSGEPPQATTAPDEALSDDDIHERLIEAIVDQRLLPGTKLVEDKLGQAFGVSRTRIRQVLIRLAQEQVVTILPNKGASVAEPTVEQAREVFEAEEAARQAGDQAMALRHSGAFHLLLAEAAGHDTFARFLHKLVSRTSLILMSYAPVERARLTMGQQPPVRWVQACRCDEHRGLLTALRAARPGQPSVDQAVALMTAHLGHIEASLCFNQPAPAQDDVFASLGAAPARAGRGRAPRTPKPG